MTTKGASASSDPNIFMPLFFAAHPTLIPSYKTMVAFDKQNQYTASSLEHKFRHWRQAGRKIIEENPNVAEAAGAVVSTPTKKAKKSTPAKKGTLGGKSGGDDEDEEEATVKNPTTNSKKRAHDATPSNPGGDGPTPKKTKKGTAKKVKQDKPARGRDSSLSDFLNDENPAEDGDGGNMKLENQED